MNLSPDILRQNAAALAALAERKPIQFRLMGTAREWQSYDPEAMEAPDLMNYEYRPAPWKLPEPPAGRRWHTGTRGDWVEGDLPEGYRPILIGENAHPEDEWMNSEGEWLPQSYHQPKIHLCSQKHRTRRPLPTEPRMVPWDSPEDVPGPVCWLREPGKHVAVEWLIVGIDSTGVCATKGESINWDQIGDYEYSTDRQTWLPCTKEAK